MSFLTFCPFHLTRLEKLEITKFCHVTLLTYLLVLMKTVTISEKEYTQLRRIQTRYYRLTRILCIAVFVLVVWSFIVVFSTPSAANKLETSKSYIAKPQGRLYHRGGSYGRY